MDSALRTALRDGEQLGVRQALQIPVELVDPGFDIVSRGQYDPRTFFVVGGIVGVHGGGRIGRLG